MSLFAQPTKPIKTITTMVDIILFLIMNSPSFVILYSLLFYITATLLKQEQANILIKNSHPVTLSGSFHIAYH
ncbi:hypothetical protein GCM10011351_31250 [Paraliobacillus quinghaiensis]|uniref:Uncharacterized protein n=1 Tax=Paraliobacillus quinghaiensis TaxID=470815 RepID=A0A917WZH8_9BACI|nr:hypothetical protein GCM10011351_31250 [Paraliobacillus quinghaiensis]